jgi:TetR/AcrR family transcriptional repressor of nem operon
MKVVDKILDVAGKLAQTVGFNAFSYRDLAAEVGIKSASIHYYFPTKDDLSQKLMMRYREKFKKIIDEIDEKSDDPIEKIRLYVKNCFSQDGGAKVCLCAMFSSDYATLSEDTQIQVRRFIEENEKWLTKTLKDGATNGKVNLQSTPERTAQSIFSSLEGAIITAYVFGNDKRLKGIDKWVREMLSANSK